MADQVKVSYDLDQQEVKLRNGCAITALSQALNRPHAEIAKEVIDAGAYSEKTGTRSTYTVKRLLEAGWKQIRPSQALRSYRRIAAFKPEHLPMGRVVVSLRNHILYIEDRVVKDTFDSVGYGRKAVRCYYVINNDDETAESFWDRADEARVAKYGKMWHTSKFDGYYENYGRRKTEVKTDAQRKLENALNAGELEKAKQVSRQVAF